MKERLTSTAHLRKETPIPKPPDTGTLLPKNPASFLQKYFCRRHPTPQLTTTVQVDPMRPATAIPPVNIRYPVSFSAP
jgi:hypothetical protein